MQKLKILFIPLLFAFCFVFAACSKGYEIRFANYNTEEMDSVLIGKDVVFKAVEREKTTDYIKIKSGDQQIKCITKTKKTYTSSVSISKKGGGKRTVQIDGLNAISILED